MITLTKKIRKTAGDIGIFATLLFAFSKLIKILGNNCGVYYYLFVRQPVPTKSEFPQNKGTSFEFQILTKNCPILSSLPRPSNVIIERFNRGYVCILATKGNQLAGCVWLSLQDYIEDEVRSIYEPQPRGEAAWDFDVYIDPKYRIGYLFAKLWDETNSYLRSINYVATVSRISGFNIRSISSHERLGAKIIGKAIYIKIGKIQLSLSNIKPYAFLSTNSNSIPEFRFI